MCPECKSFVWPIDNKSSEYTCEICGTEFEVKKRLLEPSLGFEAKKVERGVGLRRPRSRGFADVYFSQHWKGETKEFDVLCAGGRVHGKYATNGELCLVNTNGRTGFRVCAYCGAASSDGRNDIEHRYFCKKSGVTPYIERYDALGTSFTSDVLELSFLIDGLKSEPDEAWESMMWAITTAASRMLEIPETELGGTMYKADGCNRAIMLYDSVPGGAGHTLQLSGEVEQLVSTAYEIVADCDCGEDTCCYGCIANYYNQARQAKLSRGAAKRILGCLLGKTDDTSFPEPNEQQEHVGDELVAEFSYDPAGDSFDVACRLAINNDTSKAEEEFINELAALGRDSVLEPPAKEVTFSNHDGAEADALLVWKDAHVVVLDSASLNEFAEAGFSTQPVGWAVFVIGECTAQDVIDALVAQGRR
jgi:hypothetical protein